MAEGLVRIPGQGTRLPQAAQFDTPPPFKKIQEPWSLAVSGPFGVFKKKKKRMESI